MILRNAMLLVLALANLFAPFHCAIEASVASDFCCAPCGGTEHPGHEDESHGSDCAACPELEGDIVPLVRKAPEPWALQDLFNAHGSILLQEDRKLATPPAWQGGPTMFCAETPPPSREILARMPAAPRGPPALG